MLYHSLMGVESRGQGENSLFWKGENAKDASIHKWVQKHFVKLDACEHCGKPDDGERHHHWCRKDHRSHSRDPDHWLYLCASCHARYDRPGGLQRISDDLVVRVGSQRRRSTF